MPRRPAGPPLASIPGSSGRGTRSRGSLRRKGPVQRGRVGGAIRFADEDWHAVLGASLVCRRCPTRLLRKPGGFRHVAERAGVSHLSGTRRRFANGFPRSAPGRVNAVDFGAFAAGARYNKANHLVPLLNDFDVGSEIRRLGRRANARGERGRRSCGGCGQGRCRCRGLALKKRVHEG